MGRAKNQILIDFFDHEEKDLILISFGYENMNYIRPYDFSRILKNFSIHVVISGSGYITMANQTLRVQTGDCFAIPPNTKFFFKPDDNDKWEYVWFNFNGNCAETYYKNLGFDIHHPVKKCRRFKSFLSSLDCILGKYEDGASIGYYKMISLFYEFMDANINSIKRKFPNLTDRAMEYVRMHYNERDLTVEKICSALNVSHSHLSRKFRENRGITLKQFIVRIRLDAACKLLRESNLGIKEIAHAVGFADNVHFVKTFKEHIKTTPKNYKLYKNTRDFRLHNDGDDITGFIRQVTGADDE